jgi:hypothetical protein
VELVGVAGGRLGVVIAIPAKAGGSNLQLSISHKADGWRLLRRLRLLAMTAFYVPGWI